MVYGHDEEPFSIGDHINISTISYCNYITTFYTQQIVVWNLKYRQKVL